MSGSAILPHSFAYIEDVGRAAVALATHDAALGKVWIAPHAPACTQGEMVEKACKVLAIKPQIEVISPLMMRLVGCFIPEARATVEMMYEFTEPFIVDSNRVLQTFGVAATPVDSGIERTVNWYQHHASRK